MCSINTANHIIAAGSLPFRVMWLKNVFIYGVGSCRRILLNDIYSCILLYHLVNRANLNHLERDWQHVPS